MAYLETTPLLPIDRTAYLTFANLTLWGAFNRYGASGKAVSTVQLTTGSSISLTQANTKALKAPTNTPATALDGYIVMNSQVKTAGSATGIGYFSTGKNTGLGGNGLQAWRGDGTNSGIINATLGAGRQRLKADFI